MFETYIAIAGSIASIVGLGLAWFQTQKVKKLKKQKNADTWLSLREVLSLIRELEERNLPKKLKGNATVARAFTRAMALHRQLLKQAIMDEEKFNEGTLFLWVKSGKLEEKWQLNEAKKFLATNSLKFTYDNVLAERKKELEATKRKELEELKTQKKLAQAIANQQVLEAMLEEQRRNENVDIRNYPNYGQNNFPINPNRGNDPNSIIG